MRRLTIRLSLVAAVAILGTVAVVQSKMMGAKKTAKKSEDETEKEKEKEQEKEKKDIKPIEGFAPQENLFPNDDNSGVDSNTGFATRAQAELPADANNGGFRDQAGRGFSGAGGGGGLGNDPNNRGGAFNAGGGNKTVENTQQGGGGITKGIGSDPNGGQNGGGIRIVDNQGGGGVSKGIGSDPKGGQNGGGIRIVDNQAGGGVSKGIGSDPNGGQNGGGGLRIVDNQAGGGVAKGIGDNIQDNTGGKIDVPNTIGNDNRNRTIVDNANSKLANDNRRTIADNDNAKLDNAEKTAGSRIDANTSATQNGGVGNSGTQIQSAGNRAGISSTNNSSSGNDRTVINDQTNSRIGKIDVQSGRREPGLIGDTDTATQLSATPGPRELEGAQTPSLSIQKTAPAQVQVDKEATFFVIVRNTGKIPTNHVVVRDRIPQNTRFVDASGDYKKSGDQITWNLGTLAPNEQRKLSVKLIPQSEGDIGSTAQVVFQAKATVRTTSVKPKLTFTHSPLSNRVLAGRDVVFNITIANNGTGTATGLKLMEDVPAGLTHPSGPKLDNAIGILRPGEEKKLQLILKAESARKIQNVMFLRGDGIEKRSVSDLEVVAPKLSLAIKGPSVRYLNRQGTYRVVAANAGTATAENVTFSTTLPRSMRFISATQYGKYDPDTHSVRWSLEALPPGKDAETKMVLLASASGKSEIIANGSADGLKAQRTVVPVTVASIAELQFTIADTSDPVEVGDDTNYKIRVVNIGTKSATNVIAVAQVPAGLTFVSTSGQYKARADQAGRVVFETIKKLEPKQEVILTVKARGTTKGDHLFNVTLKHDDTEAAVTAQERTRVYGSGR